jgi:ligand-binding SRPBCC domain-containing protein
MHNEPAPGFTIAFERQGTLAWRLTSRQLLPLPRDEAFVFFRDPRNLNSIIPDWLEFTMVGPRDKLKVFEGAEIDYTIHWFGLRLRCRNRIEEYRPPERFTGVQLAGPYRSWRHLHTFEPVPEGTLLGEEVTYRIPARALFFEGLINRQLENIFAYRATGIAAWATKEKKRSN